MPWHTIATMIIVNMCVQCLFNLNFAHVTHINFFLRLNLLVCFFHFFFLCTYVCIYELCMYVCVCACVVVVLYWNIFQWSQVWFLFHESPQKFVFIMLQKKILAILVFIYERRFKNLLFFFICFLLDSSLSYLGDYCTPIFLKPYLLSLPISCFLTIPKSLY